MDHTTAFNLVSRYAPGQAGMLWNTSDHRGCDTAWAIADQFDSSEKQEAIAALRELADGVVPAGWEPHIPRITVCSNAEWICQRVDEFPEGYDDEIAAAYQEAAIEHIKDATMLDAMLATGQRSLYHGWNGDNLHDYKTGGVMGQGCLSPDVMQAIDDADSAGLTVANELAARLMLQEMATDSE